MYGVVNYLYVWIFGIISDCDIQNIALHHIKEIRYAIQVKTKTELRNSDKWISAEKQGKWKILYPKNVPEESSWLWEVID